MWAGNHAPVEMCQLGDSRLLCTSEIPDLNLVATWKITMMTTGVLLLTVTDACMEKRNKQEWFTVSSHKKLYNSPANTKTELPSICIAEGFVRNTLCTRWEKRQLSTHLNRFDSISSLMYFSFQKLHRSCIAETSLNFHLLWENFSGPDVCTS